MSEPAFAAVPERARPAGVTAGPGGPARRWWILGVVGLAQLMVVLDESNLVQYQQRYTRLLP